MTVKLTRRGRMLRDYVVLVLILVSFAALLVYCYNSGQTRQCQWFKQHGTSAQVVDHCRTR